MDGPDKLEGVLLFDVKKLRRAAMSSFIEPWVQERAMSIWSCGSQDDLHEGETRFNWKLSIVNVGAESLLGNRVNGISDMRQFIQTHGPCVVISDLKDPVEITCAAQLGCKAFIPSDADPNFVLQIVTFVIGGGFFFPTLAHRSHRYSGKPSEQSAHPMATAQEQLTPRQKEVLAFLRQGCSNKIIGRELDMQESTVKVHVRQVMRKLGVTNRTQAALLGGDEPRIS